MKRRNESLSWPSACRAYVQIPAGRYLLAGANPNGTWRPQTTPPQDASSEQLNVPFGTASSGGSAFVFPSTQPSPGTASAKLAGSTSDAQPPPSASAINTTNLGPGGASSSSTYLLPQSPNRMRSKSDTSLRPSMWPAGAGYLQQQQQQQQQQQYQGGQSSGIGQHMPQQGGDGSAVDLDIELDLSEGQGGGAGISMSDVSPQHSPEPGHASFGNILHPSQQQGMQQHAYSYGPPTSSSVGGMMGGGAAGFLSPDMGIGAAGLRRAKSDGGGRMGHRMVRSEDYGTARRGGMGMDMGGMGMAMGGMNMGMYPPSSHQEFISLQQQKPGQFLHPNHTRGDSLTLPSPGGGLQLPLPSIGGRGRGGGRVSGHTRRASSGTRRWRLRSRM
ncbi:hypothetical protein NEOLEDRAFT_567768 [Neolentinus lepideus HHB14362 ss-1]|uniref:Uncharacterized protein n=1 Tax=Neolentinus lepideus HHB14362 ss-1 TaxID=1314782 RepID=A0A165QYZ8_9AGAM|nr:hypothetical protein NEOLEDRAFT_567768 [Neolentinus lepideus HHB14362 ss-1]